MEIGSKLHSFLLGHLPSPPHQHPRSRPRSDGPISAHFHSTSSGCKALSAYSGVCRWQRSGETDFQPSLVNGPVHSHSQPKVCVPTVSHSLSPIPRILGVVSKRLNGKTFLLLVSIFIFVSKKAVQEKQLAKSLT